MEGKTDKKIIEAGRVIELKEAQKFLRTELGDDWNDLCTTLYEGRILAAMYRYKFSPPVVKQDTPIKKFSLIDETPRAVATDHTTYVKQDTEKPDFQLDAVNLMALFKNGKTKLENFIHVNCVDHYGLKNAIEYYHAARVKPLEGRLNFLEEENKRLKEQAREIAGEAFEAGRNFQYWDSSDVPNRYPDSETYLTQKFGENKLVN